MSFTASTDDVRLATDDVGSTTGTDDVGFTAATDDVFTIGAGVRAGDIRFGSPLPLRILGAFIPGTDDVFVFTTGDIGFGSALRIFGVFTVGTDDVGFTTGTDDVHFTPATDDVDFTTGTDDVGSTLRPATQGRERERFFDGIFTAEEEDAATDEPPPADDVRSNENKIYTNELPCYKPHHTVTNFSGKYGSGKYPR